MFPNRNYILLLYKEHETMEPLRLGSHSEPFKK